jgi:hypothetical protein
MYSRRHQHLYTGPYGLVDNYQRTIWLNLDSEEYAGVIKKTFESKLSLRVVDLRKFNNFDSANINSRTCMCWQLPIDVNTIPDVDIDFKKSLLGPGSDDLVNCSSTFLASTERVSELQDQMLLLLHVLSLYNKIKNDNTLLVTEQYISEIKKIFLVEIHILEIEKKLCALSRSFLGKSNFPGLVMNTIGCSPYA